MGVVKSEHLFEVVLNHDGGRLPTFTELEQIVGEGSLNFTPGHYWTHPKGRADDIPPQEEALLCLVRRKF